MNKRHINHVGYPKRNAIKGSPSKWLKAFKLFNALKMFFKKSSVIPTDVPPHNMRMRVKTRLLKVELDRAVALNQIHVQMIR